MHKIIYMVEIGSNSIVKDSNQSNLLKDSIEQN